MINFNVIKAAQLDSQNFIRYLYYLIAADILQIRFQDFNDQRLPTNLRMASQLIF